MRELGAPFDLSMLVHAEPKVLQISATRTLGGLLAQMDAEMPDWIVVIRAHPGGYGGRFVYAYRPSEVRLVATTVPGSQELQVALELHEWTASDEARSGRPIDTGHEGGRTGPPTRRIVEFNRLGDVIAVAEPRAAFQPHPFRERTRVQSQQSQDRILGVTSVSDSDIFHLGLTRSANEEADAREDEALHDEATALPEAGLKAAAASPPATDQIDLTLSATAPAEAKLNVEFQVACLIERSETATPLSHSIRATARPETSINVLLTSQGTPVTLIGTSTVPLSPPGPGQSAGTFFRLKAHVAGRIEMEIAFLQDGRQLGSMGLAVEVVEDAARDGAVAQRTVPVPAQAAADGTLLLKIGTVALGNTFCYEYFLYGQGFPFVERFESQPLLDAGGGHARTELDFVKRIYGRMTPKLANRDDLANFQKELESIGKFLCQQLIPKDAITKLWPLRHRIKGIQVVSFEPYVPWELVRLEHPDTQETDDRFLAEYSLVRTFSGLPAAQTLTMRDWYYLFADFPMKTHPAIGQTERAFFATPDPALFPENRKLSAIAATRDALLTALSEGNFDVLHLSCHAESQAERIETARLVISDQQGHSGKPEPVSIDTVSVAGEARLRKRAPLVFLNACETGQQGPVLTSWGGWPKVFFERGAGAFVGASWPVRDGPATAFSKSFYSSLLNGECLAHATRDARNAAKAYKDSSWLAYKVYGDPFARIG